MPLPIGHATIGLATHSLIGKNELDLPWWRTLAVVVILSNLPDIDVLIGLLVHGNGDAFHRGPTHSLIFAFVVGLAASKSWRLWARIPKISFTCCFLVILSHLLADLVFTNKSISFFWPFNMYLSTGHSGLADILDAVLFGNDQDLGIIIGCTIVMLLNKQARRSGINLKAIRAMLAAKDLPSRKPETLS
jgi:hypothetical protein